jgi:outer membrane lipoprotein-sorting protein
MGKFWKASIVAFGLTVVLGGFAAGEAGAQGILLNILDRMDKHSNALASLSSDIQLIRYNSQLNETDVNTGSVTMLPKTGERRLYARIDWVRPRAEHIVLIGDSFQLYNPRLSLLTTGKIATEKTSPGMLSLLTMSKAELKAGNIIEYFGQEQLASGEHTWHLRLTPKNAGKYRSLDLWVDGNGMPLQGMETEYNRGGPEVETYDLPSGIAELLKKVEETYGIKVSCGDGPVRKVFRDTTTFVLNRIQKNEKVDAEIFTLKPPKGTKIIKL